MSSTRWSDFGRKVVTNLTTVTTSVRGFTILLLARYYGEKLVTEGVLREDQVLELFLRMEQIGAYVRHVAHGVEDDIRGIERVKRFLAEHGKKALAGISGITLLGAAKVHAKKRYDFRDDPIDPGVYTLRMGLQPKDGNHIGTAPFDTFAMLVPHERDAKLGGIPDHDALVELSMEGTAGQHPSILSLQPMKKAEGEFPSLTEGGHDWKFLNIKLPIKVGDKTESIAVQLVYEGAGDL